MPFKAKDANGNDINPSTGAWVGYFTLGEHDVPAALFCPGLVDSGSETVSLKANTESQTYKTVTMSGSAVVLSENNCRYPIYEPGQYQISKGVTGAAVGAYISTPGYP